MAFPLYCDEDSMSSALLAAGRARDLEWLSAGEAGMAGRRDDEQLAFATSQSRSIVTANMKDFHRIHTEWMAAGRHHSGIIILTSRHIPLRHTVDALVALQARSREEMRDAILFLNNPQHGETP